PLLRSWPEPRSGSQRTASRTSTGSSPTTGPATALVTSPGSSDDARDIRRRSRTPRPTTARWSATSESWPRSCSTPASSIARMPAIPRSPSGTSTTTTTARTAEPVGGRQHLDLGTASPTFSPHTTRLAGITDRKLETMVGADAGADARVADLEQALPEVKVLRGLEERRAHQWDRALDPHAGLPLAVVLPHDTAQVQQIVRYAAERNIPLVPRGAGSGLSGGASARADGIVISMAEMTALEIDPVTRMAQVEPGVLNADLKKAAAAVGLWYPPDPASVEFSSIGGNVATNAGGLCCVKYGVTTDYVLGVTVVLADGTAVDLGGPRIKEAAGLSLTKLFVGSEGTLGIITRVVLRLVPPPPPACTVVATFSDLGASCQAVLQIASTVRPSMLEFMDDVAVGAVEDVHGYGLDRGAQAMLIAQSDQPGESGRHEVEQIAQVCRNHGAT